MGKIILSCGHEDLRKPFGWEINQRIWDEDGEALSFSHYCTQCFAVAVLTSPEDVWTNYNEAYEAIFGKT
jgi:hypothetical protein